MRIHADPQQLTFTTTKAILETAHEEIKNKKFYLVIVALERGERKPGFIGPHLTQTP
jgi:hypothetical protein